MSTGAAPGVRAPRVLDGPIAARRCAGTGAEQVWEETVRGDHTAYLPEDRLRALERVLPGRAGCLVPRIPDPGAPERAVWPAVPTRALLFDDLTAPEGPPAGAERAFEGLGRLLAAVHRVAPDRVPPGLPDRTRGAAWTGALPGPAADVHRIRGLLAERAGPALAQALAAPPARGPSALVHGRFSTALVVPGDAPALLGWREAGWGRPMADLAFMAAELVELAGAAEEGRRRRLLGLGRALLAGYGRGAGRPPSAAERAELRYAAAHRITEHMALNAVFGGGTRGPLGLLLRCDGPFAALLTATEGGTT
ncbi:phosphotransferase [Nocardiopsis potens]|uniref:phosphotransferase n=1 Tax=Nocardiopsis potens TaxID=1246458 RepID=UPI000365825F|nr:phosphotransferase [Nocardiopsis potens]